MSAKPNLYIDMYKEIFEERVEGMGRRIDKIKSKNIKEGFIDRHLDLLSIDYCDVAIGEIILNLDNIKAKQYFYLSAKIQEVLFKKYDDKTIIVAPSFVTMNRYMKILLALISDNNSLVDSLAHLIGDRTKEEQEHGHPFSNNVGYAIKYILMNNYDKAKENIDILMSMKNQKDMSLRKEYVVVLKGIIDNDIETVNRGLKCMLEDYKKEREYKNSPNELFSIPVVGFAKLAIKQGIMINFNDSIAPKIMLENNNINYPEFSLI